MPEILDPQNFSQQKLRYLHQQIIDLPFNGSHNSQSNQTEAKNFFDSIVKVLFNSKFQAYNGVDSIQKSLNIIEEIREKILDNILCGLDDPTNPDLYNINNILKHLIRNCINTNKNILKQAKYNCNFCRAFRNAINLALDNNPVLYNNSILGAWRFLDPENSRLSRASSYCCFAYNDSHELSMFGCEIMNYLDVLMIIAFYYVATKYDCSLNELTTEEQRCRFGRYMGTLTEILRGYNRDELLNDLDNPSCAGGTLSRLIEQGGYEAGITFMSKRTFIEGAINRVAKPAIAELLTNATTIEELNNIFNALTPGFSSELTAIADNELLLLQRYTIFNLDDYENNATNFFNLIKQELICIKNTFNNSDYHSNMMNNILREINNLTYQEFKLIFINQCAFSKEVKLIGYALSDPAYSCYSDITSLYIEKLKTLSPTTERIISEHTAQTLANHVVSQNLLRNIINIGHFWNVGCGVANLAIIISSYKYGIHADESDEAFVTRISGNNYIETEQDEEPTEGLDSIINPELPNRAVLIRSTANSILRAILANQNNPTMNSAEFNETTRRQRATDREQRDMFDPSVSTFFGNIQRSSPLVTPLFTYSAFMMPAFQVFTDNTNIPRRETATERARRIGI
jgi:hypothetical protein